MSRLADYFAVVGYDHENEKNTFGSGKIIQRFPEKDWPDASFRDSLALFCQPQGWSLSTERHEPKFFVSVLTDIDGEWNYCAVLSFNEPVSITSTKSTEEDEDGVFSRSMSTSPPILANRHHSIMYAPKCLVLISSLDYFDTFRDCLGIIYTVYMEGLGVNMETLIGNLVGYVQVPHPGGPQVRFSIGAGDRQALQPPSSSSIPVTQTSVYDLFQWIGIRNVLTLFCAALTEHKILFHSHSYCRLTDACRALKSILYPFKYSHVYIPILPSTLVEILSTPTPFIMGVHSSLQEETVELMDVIVADLDGGSIRVPESLTLSLLPEPFWKCTHDALNMIIQPELGLADNCFTSTSPPKAPPLVMVDKEIRTVFMRMFADFLQGYRSCLTLIRIHTKPVITFHKASFLGGCSLADTDFVSKLLDCMFFTSFVADRGLPWRRCDVWDELYATVAGKLQQERNDPKLLRKHLQDVAQQLFNIENPNPQPFVAKIPRPTEGSFARVHQPVFPHIDAAKVQQIIDEGLAKRVEIPQKAEQLRIVPEGPNVSSLQSGRAMVSSSARRLEVMKNCVNCIFDNKISDARKTFPAVLRALKSKAARLALCNELANHVSGNKAVLEHQQFDLVVRLMNCALMDDSSVDEHGVAAALLPLSTAFCRKLCTGVIQFAYTCIQDHSVWANQQFWEDTFYKDVQKEIKGLYLPFHTYYCRRQLRNSSPESTGNSMDNSWSRDRSSSSAFGNHSSGEDVTALEIAAEQLRIANSLDKNKLREMEDQEESVIYSQAIHYANRMVYLRIPLDINTSTHKKAPSERDNVSNSITNSVAESDSFDAESGFEEQEQNDREQTVIKFVSRFVDKVCTEGYVSEEHVKSLHQMIPGVVAMHVEMLDAVHRESKRLPPIQKPKILAPSLIPGEEIVFEGIRVFLLPDGREDGLGGQYGGPALFPAEGALFLTNYRLIFKGQPTDPLACELLVVRAMPVVSISKEKRIAGNQHPGPINIEHWMNDGLQVRSNGFQLLKVAFDEEVSGENIEGFRKTINRLRHPQSVQHLFAFAGQHHLPQTPSRRENIKPGYGTLRGFAKKTLMKTAKVAGLKSGKGGKRHKYVFPDHSVLHPKSLTSPGPLSLASMNNMGMIIDDDPGHDDLSIVDEMEISGLNGESKDASPGIPGGGMLVREMDGKTLERLTERTYYKDYQRLGLGSLSISSSATSTSSGRRKGDFRVSCCNSNYQLCRSYPALLSVPSSIGDESLHRLSRLYHQGRLPVITWRHAKTKGLLLRGAGLHSKGVASILKAPPPGASGAIGETSLTLEQEKFFGSVVGTTPSLIRDYSSLRVSDSSISIDSLIQETSAELRDMRGRHLSPNFSTLTPEASRKSTAFTKAMHTLRINTSSSRFSSEMSEGAMQLDGVNPQCTAALYVIGEKTQIKGIKPESFARTEFIPVEYPEVRQVKTSFKKLMRACVPSSPPSEADQSFYRELEHSEWLRHLSTILQCSGNIVNLMHMLGASVMIVLEDGWDFTAQVSSLAQLCLDPYYRTLEGFRILIEKEWLGFGHRFLHRSNLMVGSQASGFAPFFLQFLDAVHQIQRQFPMSFEFNEFYLRFLAYHSTSGRFRTFLTDCEKDRAEMGIMTEEDKRGSLSRHHKGLEASHEEDIYPGGGPRLSSPVHSMYLGQSVFNYVEKMVARSTAFTNFLYSGDAVQSTEVLRPMYDVSALCVWPFFVGEELRHGAPFDPEVLSRDKQHEEEAEAADGTSNTSRRRVVMNGYDPMLSSHQDVFSSLLEELRHLELELGHLPQKWSVHWDKLDAPPQDQFNRQVSMTTQMVRHHGRTLYKRSTLDMLIRARMVGVSSGPGGGDTPPNLYSHPHRFEKYNYTTPSSCDHCSSVLWGPLKTGMRCLDCGYNCHEKCIEQVPKNCSRFKVVRETIAPSGVSGPASKPNSHDNTSVASGVTSLQTTSQQYYEQFSSNVGENRTHEAYLWKRGHLLKNWKQRWFVLDSMKHQLRYYDNKEDPGVKGIIDLSDVVAVTPSLPAPGAPKKTDDRAFFDLQTRRRLYNFCALNGSSAQDWIEKIQSCIQ